MVCQWYTVHESCIHWQTAHANALIPTVVTVQFEYDVNNCNDQLENSSSTHELSTNTHELNHNTKHFAVILSTTSTIYNQYGEVCSELINDGTINNRKQRLPVPSNFLGLCPAYAQTFKFISAVKQK